MIFQVSNSSLRDKTWDIPRGHYLWLPSMKSASWGYREGQIFFNRCLFLCIQDSFYCTLGYQAVLTVSSWLVINQYAIQNIPSVCQVRVHFWHHLIETWHAIAMPSLSGWSQLYSSHCPWQHAVKVFVLTHSSMSFCVFLFPSLNYFTHFLTHKIEYEHLQLRCF